MLVTVASYWLPYEAHLARSKLEAEGIPAALADEHTIEAQWLFSNALGGVKVMVHPLYADAARAILAADFSASVDAMTGAEEGSAAAVHRAARADRQRRNGWAARLLCRLRRLSSPRPPRGRHNHRN